MLAQRRTTDISGNPGARWAAAMRAGDFPAAFAVNDAVLATRDPATRDDPRRPYDERWVWDGRPFAGRRVLVRCYHGLGDTLQFCRFLAPLRRHAAHVTLEVQAALIGLFRALPGIDALHPFDPARPLPPSECDIEVMELAHALRMPPDPAPYLSVAPLPGHLPGPLPGPLRGLPGHVGFCWQGGGWDPARDLPAQALRPLAGLPHLHPISLQRGPGAREAASLGAADPLNGDMDLVRLARLVAGLDAVVTVDTMVAHLAGALGRRAHVLLKHDPDWRWGDSDDRPAPWYASVRTVRQHRPGDWNGTVARLAATLAATMA